MNTVRLPLRASSKYSCKDCGRIVRMDDLNWFTMLELHAEGRCLPCSTHAMVAAREAPVCGPIELQLASVA